MSKKDKILQAALELFTMRGFKATTTKEIALRSGVAEGLIFYYFKDKNELLNHLIREFSFISSVEKEIHALSEMEPFQALMTFGQWYADFLMHHKNFLSFIWSPEIVQNTNVNEEIVHFIHIMTEHAGTHLARAVSNTVEKRTIDTAASTFLSAILMHVLVEERKSYKMSIANDSYIEEVLTLILKGLQKTD